MLERETRAEETTKSVSVNKQYLTDPVSSKNFGGMFGNFTQKIDALISNGDAENKSKTIRELVDSINLLTKQEIMLLMSSNNELVRNIAARAFVNKAPESLLLNLKKMLKDENLYIRESAVSALCYLNSSDVLELLIKATDDSCDSIRLKALTGIADIAAEYSHQEAREVLKRFLHDQNPAIREFVNDELSILS